MKIVMPSVVIEDEIDGLRILRKLESAGRTCYKSEDRIKGGSAEQFVASILESKHESVIEHEKVTVRITCDRGVSHEIVRHRLASYSQESTRYCNYSKEKFHNEIQVIRPCFWNENDEKYKIWIKAMQDSESAYFKLLTSGASPQEARAVLPNSLKTEIVATMNLRQWRHFFTLRTAKSAHPQMREIATTAFVLLKSSIPVIFDDIEPYDIKEALHVATL